MRSAVPASDRPFVRLATRADAIDLAPRLRKEDVEEIAHGTGLPPELALRYSLGVSNIAYAVVWRDRVVALFGITEWLHWGEGRGPGSPWMLASEELKDIRKSFLRHCRGYVERWLDVHGHLENQVWAKNEVHIQWLKWLGFQFDEPKPLGINNELFMRFYMTKEGSVAPDV
jgi:hypothetical protein